MSDFLNLMILAAVSLGALTLGVVLAYQILKLAFACMAPRRDGAVAKAAVQAAKASA